MRLQSGNNPTGSVVGQVLTSLAWVGVIQLDFDPLADWIIDIASNSALLIALLPTIHFKDTSSLIPHQHQTHSF